jgi:hypothetical protein
MHQPRTAPEAARDVVFLVHVGQVVVRVGVGARAHPDEHAAVADCARLAKLHRGSSRHVEVGEVLQENVLGAGLRAVQHKDLCAVVCDSQTTQEHQHGVVLKLLR